MKLMKKIISIVILAVIIISFTSQNVFAADFNWKTKTQSLVKGAKDTSSASSKVNALVIAIVNIARTVAMGVAIVMLIAVAMKYLMAAPGDRADIKKHAVVYLVGAVVLFASSGILTIIAEFAEGIG